MDGSAHTSGSFSRRGVMVGIAGMTFVVIGARRQAAKGAVQAASSIGERFSPWVSIAANGEVSIIAPATEMGQGSLTSLPLILAEELDADWSMVRVVPAPPIDKVYGNPGFGGVMHTASSAAVAGFYSPLRIFGAQVRQVLLDNVARRWRVPKAELHTEPSFVVHARTGRRISYGEIVAFARIPRTAPAITPDQLKRPEEFRLIGRDVMRIELPTKVDGRAVYAIDVQLPGMLYGAVLRCPVEGGSPAEIDDAAARAVDGVTDVVRLPYGVGVLARTPWAAFSGKSQLEASVNWRRTGKAWGFDSDEGLAAFAADARNLRLKTTVDWFKQGDADGALARAATVIAAEYRCHYAYHAQMEPLNAVAIVPPSGEAAEVWCGTQYPTAAVAAVSRALAIPAGSIRLHYKLLGGGFGRRGDYDQEFVVDAVLMARTANRPVKVIWTREDDVHNGHFRPISAHYLRAGLDAAGRLVAWHQRVVADRVLPFEDPPRFHGNHDRDYLLMNGVELKSYDIPNQYGGHIPRDTGVRTSPLRGIGFTANKFVSETFLDEVAARVGADPLKFRLMLLKNSPRGRHVVERVGQMADWDRKRAGAALGLAFIDYNDTLLSAVAEVAVERQTGEVTVRNIWSVIDCGLAVQPDNVVAQMEGGIVCGLGLALTEEISIRGGEVEQSNFYDYRVMRMNDIPNIYVEVVRNDLKPTGVGQMPVPIVAPAVCNAIARLTGVRLRETPMTPPRVREALNSESGRRA